MLGGAVAALKDFRAGELQKHEPRLWNPALAPLRNGGRLYLAQPRNGVCPAQSIDNYACVHAADTKACLNASQGIPNLGTVRIP